MQESEFFCMNRVLCHLDHKTFRFPNSLSNTWNGSLHSKVLPKWRKQNLIPLVITIADNTWAAPRSKIFPEKTPLTRCSIRAPISVIASAWAITPSSKAKAFVFSSSCYIYKIIWVFNSKSYHKLKNDPQMPHHHKYHIQCFTGSTLHNRDEWGTPKVKFEKMGTLICL